MTKDITGASLTVLCMVLGLAGLPDVARAQTFSADLVTTHAASEPDGRPGRVYVASRKVRIEAPEFTDGFFIVDGDRSGHDSGSSWMPSSRAL
jgi:hypothetical protein